MSGTKSQSGLRMLIGMKFLTWTVEDACPYNFIRMNFFKWTVGVGPYRFERTSAVAGLYRLEF